MWKNSFCLAFLFGITAVNAQENQTRFLVGTYTNACESEGIYVFDFDSKTGEASLYNNSENVVNPSYLSVSPDSKMLYAVNENGDKSFVSSFNYNKIGGSLSLVNEQKAG